MRRRLLRHLCVLALLAGALAIVVVPRPTSAQQRPTIKVRTTPYLGYGPFFIARAEGYFEEAGLTVEFIDTTSAAEAVPALARGDFDVLSGAISPGMLNAIARGARIRFVASQTVITPGGCNYQGLVASRAFAASGALSTPDRLRGARLAVRTSFVSRYFLERALATVGLSTTDIQIVEVPETIFMDALRTGRVDLAFNGEPWLTRVISSGAGILWKSIEAVIPGFEYSVVLYGPRFLDDDPELGRRFMTAYLRGVRRYNQGRTPRNTDILVADTGLSRDEVMSTCWPSVRSDGTLNEASLLDFQRWLIGQRLIDRPLTLPQILDRRFVDFANRTLSASPR